MSVPKFAILDVETTSGDPTVGRVMEVAVLAFDGDQERLRWETLVDPRTSIPPFIAKLTGITQEMINTSPTFPMVVRTLQTLTQDRIVVAHNVRYDMTSLEHEFARTGLVFDRETLCTERASKRFVPQLTHYNLGSLCRYFGVPMIGKHRAGLDAEATAGLLLKLIENFGEQAVLECVSSWKQALRA